MKRIHLLLALSFLFSATAAQAQLYKWVGPDGKVTYSDSPPPSSIKKVEAKTIGANEPSGPPLPYELAEAVKNNPVTLYTAPKCSPCDDGRKLLNERGIPFAEKTVASNGDVAKLRQLGDGQLPLLLIGRNKQQGYEASAWSTALTYAGYPESSKLPPGYRNPSPEAAVPAAPAVAAKPNGEKTVSKPSEELPPAVGNAPPGFRF
jgi:glutaredoxin